MLTRPRIQSIGARLATNFSAVATKPGIVLRWSASSIACTRPARSASSSVARVHLTLGPKSLLRIEREDQLLAPVPSLQAAPLIAESEMRCSVPSMP